MRLSGAAHLPFLNQLALLFFQLAPYVWKCICLAAVAAEGELRLLCSGICGARIPSRE